MDITKHDLQQFADYIVDSLRKEISHEGSQIRQEMHDGQTSLRQEMHDGQTSLQQEMHDGEQRAIVREAAMEKRIVSGVSDFLGGNIVPQIADHDKRLLKLEARALA